MTYKIGDIVTHVLGGPLMQVKVLHSEKLVECFWFDGHGVPHQKGFLTADLVAGPVPVPAPVAAGEGEPQASPSSGAKGRAKAKAGD